jgi:pyruvate/2-oxoglutarate dehydrogenase complex dihydrolipoamide acyltransferase (E2) component
MLPRTTLDNRGDRTLSAGPKSFAVVDIPLCSQTARRVTVRRTKESDVTRDRGVEIRPFPMRRRLVTGALRAGRRSSTMHGLIQVDVTEAYRAAHAARLSFTAFVVSCVGRAVAAHPDVHAYRDWCGRLVIARHVDIGTLVEVSTKDGPLPVAHLIRDADIRDAASITAEIRAVQADLRSSLSGQLLERYAPFAARVPGLIGLFYLLLARSRRMREICGTVAVTAVGMFGEGGGYGLPSPGFLTLTVLVGGMSERAVVIDGQIRVRRILDLTLSFHHDVVDGAPAARFVADLRRMLESPCLASER